MNAAVVNKPGHASEIQVVKVFFWAILIISALVGSSAFVPATHRLLTGFDLGPWNLTGTFLFLGLAWVLEQLARGKTSTISGAASVFAQSLAFLWGALSFIALVFEFQTGFRHLVFAAFLLASLAAVIARPKGSRRKKAAALKSGKIEDIQDIYLRKGFFWNDDLADFAGDYVGREISYLHPYTGDAVTARFFPALADFPDRAKSICRLIVEYLGEEIAPVGDCNQQHIELFLTKSGKLIGFADYLLLRWGEEELKWRASLDLLLQGAKETKVGVIDTSNRTSP
jgi:hypothetical protein